MKNIFRLLGIIALVAVIGLSMVGCETEDDGGGGNGNSVQGVAPSVPTRLRIADSPSKLDSGLYRFGLGWDSVSGATFYEIYISSNNTGNYRLYNTNYGNYRNIINLEPSTTYYFYLVAVNEVGKSPPSSIISVKTGS